MVEWLFSYKKIILSFFLAMLVAMVLIYRLISMWTLKDERDFFRAQTLFTKFQKEDLLPQDASLAMTDFEQLMAIMQKQIDLKALYQGPLAQTLLIAQQGSQASLLMEDIFKRTTLDHLALYHDYAKTSLLVSEKQYEIALMQAQQLQQAIQQANDSNHYLILDLFNLIRVATLHQQLGQFQEELQAWKQLEKPFYSKVLLSLNQTFKMGQSSFQQYIDERKALLTQ